MASAALAGDNPVVPADRVRVFVSYSHKDEDFRNELDKCLNLMERTGLLSSWNDRRILAGDQWGDAIDENLRTADVILLLISIDFVNSTYCYDIEMDHAIARAEKGEAIVIPVILRACQWSLLSKISKFQALPAGGRAVAEWESRDQAYLSVGEGLRLTVEKLRQVGRGNAKGWLVPERVPPLDPRAPGTDPNSPTKQVARVSMVFESLAQLLRNDIGLRDEAVKFQTVFEQTQTGLEHLENCKWLHELLHQIELKICQALKAERGNFPPEGTLEGDEKLDRLTSYHRQFGELLSRLSEAVKRPTFVDLLSDWCDWQNGLLRAEQHLEKANMQSDPKELDQAVLELERALALCPSEIEVMMRMYADGLPLQSLTDALQSMSDTASARGIEGKETQVFSEGIGDLRKLVGDLRGLVTRHKELQKLDNHFRRVEKTLKAGLDELKNSWPTISRSLGRLWEGHPDGERLGNEVKRFEVATGEGNERVHRQSFRNCRAFVSSEFKSIDARLLELCENLRSSGKHLTSILDLLKGKAGVG